MKKSIKIAALAAFAAATIVPVAKASALGTIQVGSNSDATMFAFEPVEGAAKYEYYLYNRDVEYKYRKALETTRPLADLVEALVNYCEEIAADDSVAQKCSRGSDGPYFVGDFPLVIRAFDANGKVLSWASSLLVRRDDNGSRVMGDYIASGIVLDDDFDSVATIIFGGKHPISGVTTGDSLTIPQSKNLTSVVNYEAIESGFDLPEGVHLKTVKYNGTPVEDGFFFLGVGDTTIEYVWSDSPETQQTSVETVTTKEDMTNPDTYDALPAIAGVLAGCILGGGLLVAKKSARR